MTTLLARALDAAFGHPRGIAGRLGGAIMARGNAEQEQWALDHAELRPGARVLGVGIGPGVGVALAARMVAPDGHVVGVDPSDTMLRLARARCAGSIDNGLVELRAGTAEDTGCADSSMDAAVSVNNVMLWDRPAGFAELHRVLRPDGTLVLTVHRHVLDAPPEHVRDELTAAGFTVESLSLRPRRLNSPAIELMARRA
jgi:ubiquinone/menaquinone biosynthesis C-methylase UbiE